MEKKGRIIFFIGLFVCIGAVIGCSYQKESLESLTYICDTKLERYDQTIRSDVLSDTESACPAIKQQEGFSNFKVSSENAISIPPEIHELIGPCQDGILCCNYLEDSPKESEGLLRIQYAKYFLDTGRTEALTEPLSCFTVIGNIYDGSGVIFCILRPGDQSTAVIYKLRENGDLTELHTFHTTSVPEYCFAAGYFYIGYELYQDQILYQKIQGIHMETGEVYEIAQEDLRIEEDGSYNGNMLYRMSGDENGLLFQRIAFSGEEAQLDDTGDVQLIYWDRRTGQQEPFMSLDKKASFVGGTKDVLVVSDYAYARALENTGKLYLKTAEGGYAAYQLPDIESVNDIKRCEVIGNEFLVLQSYKDVYFIDLKGLVYEKIENARYSFVDGNQVTCYDKKNSVVTYTLEAM